MFYSDDPAADYDRYCAEKEKELAKRPVCAWCGEYIVDDECYEISGELVCCDCIDDCRRAVENYVG